MGNDENDRPARLTMCIKTVNTCRVLCPNAQALENVCFCHVREYVVCAVETSRRSGLVTYLPRS